MECHENCTSEGRVTSDKVLCSSSKVPFIVNITRHALILLVVRFQENPSNGNRVTSEKVLSLFRQRTIHYWSIATKHATSVHALPCACRRLAFLCPTWQRPSSSKMTSMRARSLFLLENTALKCDLSGVGRRSKHDILQSRYQLGEFHHLYNDLRKDSTKFFEYCRKSPSTFDYIVQAIRQYISHISTNFQKTISVEEKLFVTLR